MKRRIRWYHLESRGAPISRLVELMFAEQYTEDSGSGFQIYKSPKTSTAGSFIEKVKIEDVVEDPFGGILRFERVEFRKVGFKLFPSTRPNLEISDPPRSCKNFFMRIGAMLDHRVSVDPIQPDVRRWLAALEKQIGKKVSVRAMALGGVALSGSVSADVLVSGGVDVRKEANALLNGRKANVASVELFWQQDGAELSCELTRNGASYDEATGEDMQRILRAALRESILEPLYDDVFHQGVEWMDRNG